MFNKTIYYIITKKKQFPSFLQRKFPKIQTISPIKTPISKILSKKQSKKTKSVFSKQFKK